MENHAQYGAMIYAHAQDDLYVNLFIASELSWADKGLTLRQETHFPDDDRTTLKFTLDRPARFTLKLRWPGWAALGRMTVRVNGAVSPTTAQPGSFVALARTWKTGDVVEVDVPRTVTAEPLPHGSGNGRLPGRPDPAGRPARRGGPGAGRLPRRQPAAPPVATSCSTWLRRFRWACPGTRTRSFAPAREGALRVLRAARDAEVRRVVLTSSFAAIGYGQAPAGGPFTEESWTDPEGHGVPAPAYVKSKTLAERAAWDFSRCRWGQTASPPTQNPTIWILLARQCARRMRAPRLFASSSVLWFQLFNAQA